MGTSSSQLIRTSRDIIEEEIQIGIYTSYIMCIFQRKQVRHSLACLSSEKCSSSFDGRAGGNNIIYRKMQEQCKTAKKKVDRSIDERCYACIV